MFEMFSNGKNNQIQCGNYKIICAAKALFRQVEFIAAILSHVLFSAVKGLLILEEIETWDKMAAINL